MLPPLPLVLRDDRTCVSRSASYHASRVAAQLFVAGKHTHMSTMQPPAFPRVVCEWKHGWGTDVGRGLVCQDEPRQYSIPRYRQGRRDGQSPEPRLAHCSSRPFSVDGCSTHVRSVHWAWSTSQSVRPSKCEALARSRRLAIKRSGTQSVIMLRKSADLHSKQKLRNHTTTGT